MSSFSPLRPSSVTCCTSGTEGEMKQGAIATTDTTGEAATGVINTGLKHNGYAALCHLLYLPVCEVFDS